ncbi:septum-promoting GTP-binding protein 1-like [Actinidia eriantha]|uniref:septum-promoting GTP-binding protein 1-like n=1 Tax=Actinidia eriantha TaxID=165200 RepID=UPI0025845F30|nr:septum-promoting GTP-binding protein 1-like [Actinidia eriantha]
MFRLGVSRRRVLWRFSLLHRCLRSFWNQILACKFGKSAQYRQLSHRTMSSPAATERGFESGIDTAISSGCCDSSDLVALKISLLGDCQIGKTSFLKKYVGGEREQGEFQMTGLNRMDKTLCLRGARIAYNIWEVKGDETCQNHIPTACNDSVAIFIMFDLTSRCTLNSVIGWYQEARKWNQTAIPVLIGTKFDDFDQLPIDLQWTIANQARAYAKALNATLFFSSATYNINVNKIFKFITAKLFNLPWSLERNLTIGEPIIDF